MPKTKLTLYVDEKTSRLAKKTAKLSGKSVSALVQEFFKHKAQARSDIDIDEPVMKWIGILKSKKGYKELREESLKERLKKYEDSD